ncbi:hypothetical protein Ahy_A04g020784 isoform P [Arachis hypogaea]|uniref:Uncharacterized protein n=1 Tax=Arachis hypogaea TaxID=3818 RepID=A0A445DIL6_ARAHY|nr:hypothetical protein Ahy_A04g020784 isoform P [Arachis hypogaea]
MMKALFHCPTMSTLLMKNSLIQATWITWRGQSHTTTMRMNSLDVNSLNPNAPMASSRKNLTLQLPNTLGVQKKLTPGAGGVHLHKQVHLRSLNCLDDSVEFATPPSAPPIIDADFPPQLERFSKGSPMNEQNDSWPSRESVAGRSECSIEQKPSNVKATTDFAQRLDRTITEDTERPHLAYYNTSCNSQYAWQTLITYDACICLCLQAWARGCTEAPEFLKDECLALRSAFGGSKVDDDLFHNGSSQNSISIQLPLSSNFFGFIFYLAPDDDDQNANLEVKFFARLPNKEEVVIKECGIRWIYTNMEKESRGETGIRFKQTQIRLWFGISSKQDPSNTTLLLPYVM